MKLKKFLSLVLILSLAFCGPVFAACDANTVFLTHANGADASTTILDSSPNAITVTAAGNAQLDTAQKKFGTASVLLDGSGDDIKAADNAAYDVGTGNFTLDFWFRFASETESYIFNRLKGASGNHIGIYYTGSDVYVLYIENTEVISMTYATAVDTWYHIAVERRGTGAGQVELFMNGVSQQVGASSGDITGTTPLTWGSNGAGNLYSNVWIDEARFSNTARYGGTDFTPETTEYCPSRRIVMVN